MKQARDSLSSGILCEISSTDFDDAITVRVVINLRQVHLPGQIC